MVFTLQKCLALRKGEKRQELNLALATRTKSMLAVCLSTLSRSSSLRLSTVVLAEYVLAIMLLVLVDTKNWYKLLGFSERPANKLTQPVTQANPDVTCDFMKLKELIQNADYIKVRLRIRKTEEKRKRKQLATPR